MQAVTSAYNWSLTQNLLPCGIHIATAVLCSGTLIEFGSNLHPNFTMEPEAMYPWKMINVDPFQVLVSGKRWGLDLCSITWVLLWKKKRTSLSQPLLGKMFQASNEKRVSSLECESPQCHFSLVLNNFNYPVIVHNIHQRIQVSNLEALYLIQAAYTQVN